MKINELIAEQQDIDEGLGSFLGKAAGHAVGGVSAAWRDAKQGYKDAKAVWDPKDPPGTYPNAAGVPPTGTPPAATAPAATGTPAATGAPTETPPAASGEPAPATDIPAAPATGDVSGIMQTIDKLDKTTKQQLAGELQKNIASAPKPAPAATTPPANPTTPATATATPGPAGTTYDPAKAAADKLAKGQADQQQAQQQMAATKQANAATNQQDAAIKAAADAAKAKSGFQQTAADKLAIKAAADKGIREAKKNKLTKKKKIVAEFHSNFLNKKI